MKKIIIMIIFIFAELAVAQVALKTVECALTYRIMHFTDIIPVDGILNICVSGDKEIQGLLEKQLANQEFKGSVINIISANGHNLKSCSVIYLGEKTQITKLQIGSRITSHKMLVFSSIESFKNISMVNFQKTNNKIEFNINKTLLDKNKIIMSTKVLRLASEVY